MQDFLNRVGKQASRAAEIAGNKATEMVEITKLKTKLSDVNKANTLAKNDIGEYCYALYKKGEITDPRIIEYCKKIDAAIEVATEIEEEIAQAKNAYAVMNEVSDPSLND